MKRISEFYTVRDFFPTMQTDSNLKGISLSLSLKSLKVCYTSGPKLLPGQHTQSLSWKTSKEEETVLKLKLCVPDVTTMQTQTRLNRSQPCQQVLIPFFEQVWLQCLYQHLYIMYSIFPFQNNLVFHLILKLSFLFKS